MAFMRAALASMVGSPATWISPTLPRHSKLLPVDQKEALILIGAEGFSYDEAAVMCGCAVGTIKSRVNRARSPSWPSFCRSRVRSIMASRFLAAIKVKAALDVR